LLDIGRIMLHSQEGTKKNCITDYKIKDCGNVKAFYIDAGCDSALDSDMGCTVDFIPKNVKRWMVDYRHAEFWCRPGFGKDFKDIPDNTQGLFCEKNDGNYIVFLPVVDEKYKCFFEGTEDGFVRARLFSWYEDLKECKTLAFVYAEGNNPYELMRQCAKAGVELLGNRIKLIEEREYPEIFEYLGWCSWDAFEIRVGEENIDQKCREFKEKNIPVKWAIIDDMWAEVHDFYDAPYKTRQEMFKLMHSSRLYSFKADPKRFPGGLKKCIENVNSYGIKVGMWHPTTGYWLGIDKDGEIYKEHKDLLLQVNQDMVIPSYEREKAYKFYDAFHSYLEECNTEFVKIDNQSMTRRFYQKYAPVGQVARQFHDAMEQSVKEHFGGKMINCMGMASEDMWNRSDSPISRCSDDFQPEDRAWFTKHILQCSYNCLVQGQFYICDWDMWWTDDGQAVKNSVIRAISGGPIYVSDTLNRSRAEILKPLCFDDGRILRCDRPAVPARESLMEDPTDSGKIFKLQNTANGCGILAVFNLDKENGKVTGSISSRDIEGLVGEEFGFYEYFSKELVVKKKDECFGIELEDNDRFKIFVIVPLENGNGMIGRIDKFISPKSFEKNSDGSFKFIENGPCARIENRKLIFFEGEG